MVGASYKLDALRNEGTYQLNCLYRYRFFFCFKVNKPHTNNTLCLFYQTVTSRVSYSRFRSAYRLSKQQQTASASADR